MLLVWLMILMSSSTLIQCHHRHNLLIHQLMASVGGEVKGLRVYQMPWPAAATAAVMVSFEQKEDQFFLYFMTFY